MQKFELKKYVIGFKDLLAMEIQVLTDIVAHLSNEVVASALHGQDSNLIESILEPMSKLRRKFIENLLHTQRPSRENIEEAQSTFVREYRRRN